jgi:hypothetical protein
MFQHMLQPFTSETVNGVVIRRAHATDPHEVYVFLKYRFQLTTAVNVVQVAIYQHL